MNVAYLEPRSEQIPYNKLAVLYIARLEFQV